jgi:hypothetical protein
MSGTIPSGLRLEIEEQQVMDALAMIVQKVQLWGLRANLSEMTTAVHVLQGFVIQHMLHRVDPEQWSDWFGG